MLSDGHAIQLALVLLAALMMFVSAYVFSERRVLAVLILLIPFQVITSRYGTLNVALIYLAGLAFLLQGRFKHFPHISAVALIFVVYLLSMALTLRATYRDHGFYLVTIASNFLLFYMVYNYFARNNDVRYAFKLLVWMNALVIGYCILQLGVGFNQMALFGVAEWQMGGNLEDRGRLVGPFGPPGPNAGYFALSILLLGYALIHASTRSMRAVLISLILGNFAFLVATGNRGGFLSLIVGGFAFLWIFRRDMGVLRALRLGVGGLFGGTLMAALIVVFTPYNVLFERLKETEFEGYAPESRSKAWEMAIEAIPDRLMLGHGPQMKLIDAADRYIPGYETIPYPHNLYLFLLYSLGVIGLIVYLVWFFKLSARWWASRQVRGPTLIDDMTDSMSRIGLLFMFVFLFDQLKVEFLRLRLSDYQHYVFVVWAMVEAFAEHTRRAKRQAAAPPRETAPAPAPLDAPAEAQTPLHAPRPGASFGVGIGGGPIRGGRKPQ